MSPDNIGSAVNRFSGWPSNDPLKTDNESMTSPVAVQVIKWICPYISRHLLSLNPLQARCRRYSRG
ncbi:hypothetical protein GUA75_22640, partial [Escherichia coli]|nr:hypothetical protein [Escherichia coli]